MMLNQPVTLLRLEGLALLAGAIALYAGLDGTWWWIPVLFLMPDIAAIGYLAGNRIGAMAYNALHTTVPPTALGIVGLAAGSDTTMLLALIWLFHIGVDRLVGYGLKYPDQFGNTHLGFKGRTRAPEAATQSQVVEMEMEMASNPTMTGAITQPAVSAFGISSYAPRGQCRMTHLSLIGTAQRPSPRLAWR